MVSKTTKNYLTNSNYLAQSLSHSKPKKETTEPLHTMTKKTHRWISLASRLRFKMPRNQLISSGRTDNMENLEETLRESLFGHWFSSCLVFQQLLFTDLLWSVTRQNSCSHQQTVTKLTMTSKKDSKVSIHTTQMVIKWPSKSFGLNLPWTAISSTPNY